MEMMMTRRRRKEEGKKEGKTYLGEPSGSIARLRGRGTLGEDGGRHPRVLNLTGGTLIALTVQGRHHSYKDRTI